MAQKILKKITLVFKNLKSDLKVTDIEFDTIYPEQVRDLAEIYFTPIEVVKIAAQFLVDKPGTKVLDIGSGAGKFCMIGSVYTNGHFTGVEQRENLHLLSKRILQSYRLSNIKFIHSNITKVEFAAFNAFYLFNPFYENVDLSGNMDGTIELDRMLYDEYSLYVKSQLDEMPIGTKLVTYFSYLNEIPDSYKVQSKGFDDKLKMWQKV